MLKKVLVLGAGFGGIRAALDLDRQLRSTEAEITLVDRNNYHLFLPALYEVASAYSQAADHYSLKLRQTVNIPLAAVFAETKVKLAQGEVAKIDLLKQQVTTAGEHDFAYDYLVLALGSETETFNTPGVEEYAYKFKTIDEAIYLNKQIIAVAQKAAAEKRTAPIKIIVVGAGFNGIELAGELAGCLKNVHRTCLLKEQCFDLKILERGPKILPLVSEKERQLIEKRLKKLGIEIIGETAIKQVGPNFVETEAGKRWETDFVIWTAGVRPAALLRQIDNLPLDERGRIKVNSFLQVENFPSVWAVGDNNVFLDPLTQKPLPGLAYVAVDQGKVAAENISRLLKRGRSEKKRQKRPTWPSLKAYRPFYNVWVAPVGGKYAVAHLTPKLILTGFGGWLIRLLIDFRYLVSILPFSRALKTFYQEQEMFLKND